jgi:DNA-directed RNA polymerase specialized sigma24 family protein
VVRVLESSDQVIWALLTYTDWWQPSTTSVYQVSRRRPTAGDGIHPGLLDGLPVRDELCRRMQELHDRDRQVLYLWYLKQRSADEIASELHISRRQCFRRRSAAVAKLVELGRPDDADRVA